MPTIVIADDDALSRELVRVALQNQGYCLEIYTNGRDAVTRVERGGVDLVLLDVMMPELSGFDACRMIKDRCPHFVPVLMVTAKSDASSRVQGLQIGADDYISKPFDSAELVARVDAMLRIRRGHRRELRRVRLEENGTHDPLTHVYSSRYMAARFSEEIKRAERYREPLVYMLIDVDALREHNARGGRARGDLILRAVAERVRHSLRETDIVGRVGGDEFVALLPNTPFGGALVAAERMWSEVALKPVIEEPSTVLWADLSLGVAAYPCRDFDAKDSLPRAAELALKHAKAAGGGRVAVFRQQGQIYVPPFGRERAPERGTPSSASAVIVLASEPPQSRGPRTGRSGKE